MLVLGLQCNCVKWEGAAALLEGVEGGKVLTQYKNTCFKSSVIYLNTIPVNAEFPYNYIPGKITAGTIKMVAYAPP